MFIEFLVLHYSFDLSKRNSAKTRQKLKSCIKNTAVLQRNKEIKAETRNVISWNLNYDK